jgi:hypothetical protein
MKRIVFPALLAAFLSGGAAFDSAPAQAFCCPAINTVSIAPVSPPVRPRVLGRVEVNECVGLSFLHIVVRANVPDGTQLMAVIRPTTPFGQPLMSDWITMTANRGELVWQGVTTPGAPSGGLAGRTVTIVDSNFTDLGTASF